MAKVTLPDGRCLAVDDRDAAVLDYYRGLGAAVGSDAEDWPAVEETPAVVEFDAWVASSTVAELLEAVDAEPDLAAAVLAAEQRRDEDARKTLVEALQGAAAESAALASATDAVSDAMTSADRATERD